MVAGIILFVNSKIFTDFTVWANMKYESSFAALVIAFTVYIAGYVILVIAIEIAGYAKPRLMRMFWHDVQAIRENNQIEEVREE